MPHLSSIHHWATVSLLISSTQLKFATSIQYPPLSNSFSSYTLTPLKICHIYSVSTTEPQFLRLASKRLQFPTISLILYISFYEVLTVSLNLLTLKVVVQLFLPNHIQSFALFWHYASTDFPYNSVYMSQSYFYNYKNLLTV